MRAENLSGLTYFAQLIFGVFFGFYVGFVGFGKVLHLNFAEEVYDSGESDGGKDGNRAVAQPDHDTIRSGKPDPGGGGETGNTVNFIVNDGPSTQKADTGYNLTDHPWSFGGHKRACDDGRNGEEHGTYANQSLSFKSCRSMIYSPLKTNDRTTDHGVEHFKGDELQDFNITHTPLFSSFSKTN